MTRGAGFGQAQTAPFALEQGKTEVVLELADGVRNGRGTTMQGAGRGTEAAVMLDGIEDA